MRFNRVALSTSILRRFAFLAKEYHLRKKDLGMADEWVDRYQDDAASVTITLSYPDLPFVILETKRPASASYRYFPGRSGQIALLKKRYYATLDRHPRSYDLLLDLQVQFADIQASALRAALESLRTNPGGVLGNEWVRQP